MSRITNMATAKLKVGSRECTVVKIMHYIINLNFLMASIYELKHLKGS
jgi:hypothetical protein